MEAHFNLATIDKITEIMEENAGCKNIVFYFIINLTFLPDIFSNMGTNIL